MSDKNNLGNYNVSKQDENKKIEKLYSKKFDKIKIINKKEQLNLPQINNDNQYLNGRVGTRHYKKAEVKENDLSAPAKMISQNQISNDNNLTIKTNWKKLLNPIVSNNFSTPKYTINLSNNLQKLAPLNVNNFSSFRKQVNNSALDAKKRNKNIVSKIEIDDFKSHFVGSKQHNPLNIINIVSSIKSPTGKRLEINIKTKEKNDNHTKNSSSCKNTPIINSNCQFNSTITNTIPTDMLPKSNPSQSNLTANHIKLAYSYKEDQNSFFRDNMEDMYKIIECYLNDSNKQLFCLYDGHGSGEIAKFAKDHFAEIFSTQLTQSKNNIEKALTNSFLKLDDEIKSKILSENAGSTACVCYFTTESNKRVLYTANVGDTRAVLVSKAEVKRLSYDDKCSDHLEEQRVKTSGGIIFNGRVFGQLILTRALGDHSLKKCGVISTPHINKHFITETDQFLTIASDGVWDVIKDEDLINIFSNNSSLDINQLASLIVSTALELESKDNISCILIKIN